MLLWHILQKGFVIFMHRRVAKGNGICKVCFVLGVPAAKVRKPIGCDAPDQSFMMIKKQVFGIQDGFLEILCVIFAKFDRKVIDSSQRLAILP